MDSLMDVTQAIPDPWSIPLEDIDPAQARLFKHDKHWGYFERLRKESPVHYTREHEFGPYWSVTKFNDIMFVDTNHELFSSEPSITIAEPEDDFRLPMFIAMDPPKHDIQRKTVSPIVSPQNLAAMESLIRSRSAEVLDNLPRNETFNWVDRVSIELTTQMLATLFDFPWEDRRKLTRWSDVATATKENTDIVADEEARRAELFECVEYFTRLWNERVNAPPKPDLISMLAHGEHTRNMDRMEYLGNLILLIVGATTPPATP
jgi:cytochrome P450